MRVVRDACHGLDYAHRAGVVHRDVKPGNLLVASESNTTKLADFGIAKAAEQTRITQVGSVLGTAAYLSPEQARGQEAGPASDIYSLGVCAYQFLAGRLPHEYSSLTELALKQQEDAVEPITIHRPGGARRARSRDPRVPGARPRRPLQLDPGDGPGDGRRARRRGDRRHPPPGRGGPRRHPRPRRRDRGHAGAAHAIRPARPRRRGAPPPASASPTPKAQRKARRARRLGTILAVLAVLMAIAAVVLALTASNGGGGLDPIDRGTVDEQVDSLKQFLRENTR